MLAGASPRRAQPTDIVGQIADGKLRNAPLVEPEDEMAEVATIGGHRVARQMALARRIQFEGVQPRFCRAGGFWRLNA